MAKGYGKIGGAPRSGGNMKAQVQTLQKQMQEQQAKIAEMETTTTVGGGAIKITMTGDQVCKSVVIDPEFLKDSDAETLQDILLSGFNMALEQSRKLADENMGFLGNTLSSLGLNF